MSIILPGYEALIPNQVYVKDAYISAGAGKFAAKDIVLLRKFTLPYEGEVVSYLQQKIDEQKLSDSPAVTQQLSPLEVMITNFPGELKTLIKTNEGNTIKLLKACIPATAGREGWPPRQSLQVKHGLALAEYLQSAKCWRKNPGWYHNVLFSVDNDFTDSNGIERFEPVEQWTVQLSLNDNALPKKEVIDSLLELGSAASVQLQVARFGIPYVNYPKQDVQQALDLVYESLQGRAAEVADLSRSLLEQNALKTLINFLANQLEEVPENGFKNEFRGDDDLPAVFMPFGNNNKSSEKPN